MKFWFRMVILALFVPCGVVAVADYLNRNGFFDLDHIEVVLLESSTKSLHLKPLVDDLDRSLEAYRGRSLWTLNLEDVSKKIGALKWIEVHSVSRSWPSSLTVKIRPYEVKALFMAKGERLIPVIRDGRMLDPVAPTAAPDVALLEGSAFQAQADLRRKALEMLEEIPEDGAFSRKTISEVRWDSKDGFRLKMTKSGIDVNLGEDLFAIKSARVSQVLEYLKDRGIEAQALDANLSKKVLVRLAQPTQGIRLQ